MIICFSLQGQTQTVLEKGTVTFISRLSVYVKFPSTEKIEIGDTLFIKKSNDLIPTLIISNKSSTSTVCRSISDEKLEKSDELFVKFILEKEEKKKKQSEEEQIILPKLEEEMVSDQSTLPTVKQEEKESIYKQKIKGRLSAASYSSLSDYKNSHRMRYGFSFKGSNLKNSKFSADSHITFRHTIGEWDVVQENLGRALKVYSLSIKYEFDEFSSLTLGRKINPKISSMGAIDGFQYERRLGTSLFLGAIGGTRPSFTDYSLDFNLPQIGGYISVIPNKSKNYQQSTLGFIEQRNHAKTDRRLVYFQHTGELLKNLNLFSSFEIDLYENINNETNNTFRLTNLYVSLRHRISKKLKLSVSYDNRKNIIYYESYKNFIDRLIENETRQGLRLGFNYRPVKLISWGVNSSLRFQGRNENVSRNFNTYINITRIPIINVRAALRANFLETNYLKSQIFGVRIFKEIIKRKLNGEVYYRIINYNYKSNDRTVNQSIVGASFSLRIMKKLSLYLYYEGTFEDKSPRFTRFNTKLIQRF